MKMKASRLGKLMLRAGQINDTFAHFLNNEWIFDNTRVDTLINYLQGSERDTF